ncbi:MAG: DUF423 domain-containing protein [Flavobacteriaceae bacterium]|nr:DUF423 domain-containing protein [Bacteroidia bacterium]NND09789.1 DUF423 domain-containing protein [Flavobacteriaceae bacterium]NNL61256.1 DUF423 domain-containing protein [Flavobacteriaceae bacterium]
MNKKTMITAAILGVLAIILGAFASHGLKAAISTDALDTFETGVRYQMYHALFLLFVGLNDSMGSKTKRTLLILVVAGVLLFSGSIYGLATNELSAVDFKKIAFVTPIGGFLLILSWLVLLFDLIKNAKD